MVDNPNPVSPLLAKRYQLQQTLGSGGMAMVYKAWDLRLERPVAVKILRHDFSNDPTISERFRMEAKAAANLSHPNIVTVYDFGLDDGKLFIVIEYVPGTDLKTMIKHHGRFTLDEAIPLMVQACAGIGYAHRAGLVHCDVKPHNMLVTPDQRLKVTDFGIARVLATIHPDEKNDVVWGSPQYFSPEQATGAAPSPSSDVYSLGVILYELLTGRLPFIANNPTELSRMHREVTPIPPRKFNPAIPEALDQIIMKVLSKEPSARYRSADQLGRILVNFSHQADAYLANISPTAQMGNQGISTPSADPTTPNLPSSAAQTSNRINFPPPFNPTRSQAMQDETPYKTDWGTILLGLLTVLVVGGLIPWWLYVYFSINPPK
jgi:serine/threonine protein kinase